MVTFIAKLKLTALLYYVETWFLSFHCSQMDSLKSFVSHVTVFQNFACATITGQRSLTAGFLKIDLSNSDWLKIKCNNSIGSGGGHK